MATQIIAVPGEGNVEFPSSMSDADIAKAIKTHLATTPPPVQTKALAEIERNMDVDTGKAFPRSSGMPGTPQPPIIPLERALEVGSEPGLANKAEAASMLIRGAGQAVAPIAAPMALMASPAAAVGGAIGGTAAGVGADAVLSRTDLPQGYKDLATDAAGAVGGALGAKAGQGVQALAQHFGGLLELAKTTIANPAARDAIGLISPRLKSAMSLVNRGMNAYQALKSAGLTGEELDAASEVAAHAAGVAAPPSPVSQITQNLFNRTVGGTYQPTAAPAQQAPTNVTPAAEQPPSTEPSMLQVRPSQVKGAGESAPLFDGKWDETDLATIQKYKQMIERGDAFRQDPTDPNSPESPILLVKNADGSLSIQDGYHRLAAAKQAGDVPLTARIVTDLSQDTLPGNRGKQWTIDRGIREEGEGLGMSAPEAQNRESLVNRAVPILQKEGITAEDFGTPEGLAKVQKIAKREGVSADKTGRYSLFSPKTLDALQTRFGGATNLTEASKPASETPTEPEDYSDLLMKSIQALKKKKP